MAKAGYTKKPCHGCGENNYRKSDSVCPDCLSLLETGRMHIKEYNNMVNDDSFIEIKIPTSWEQPRYSAYKVNPYSDTYKTVGKLITELAHLLAIKKGKKPTWGYMRYLENKLRFEEIDDNLNKDIENLFNDHSYFFKADAVMPKTVFSKLVELHDKINESLSETEIKAVEYGKNALLMLNNGDITNEDFYKK